MAVRPVTIGNQAHVEWSSRFGCDEPDEGKTAAQIRDGVLVQGLSALGERFSRPQDRHPARRRNARVATRPACVNGPAAGRVG
jgi:hypothetical protein